MGRTPKTRRAAIHRKLAVARMKKLRYLRWLCSESSSSSKIDGWPKPAGRLSPSEATQALRMPVAAALDWNLSQYTLNERKSWPLSAGRKES